MKAILSTVSEIKVGFQSREGIRMEADGGYMLVQARDFNKQHQIQWSTLLRFNPSGGISRYELRRDDVLFLARGHENFAYYIDRDIYSTLAANSFYILRAKKEVILPPFLAWWLNQTPAQEYIKLRRSGSTIPFISIALLSKIEISIPSFEIQNKILVLENLQKREMDLTASLLEKKSVLIETICLNAINE